MGAASYERTDKAAFGPLQIGILLLGLATAAIHLVALNLSMGKVDPLFTLNGLGYLALLAAYFLPLPILRQNHGLVRWALIGFATLTILAWVIMGKPYTTLGYLTKLIEAGLIGLLLLDRRS
jgi:hypothetical protein